MHRKQGGDCGTEGNYSCCIIYVFSVQTEDLIKALQDLENAASGDATVRQKIASLPQEVQDVSLLEKITGKVLKGGEAPNAATKKGEKTLKMQRR